MTQRLNKLKRLAGVLSYECFCLGGGGGGGVVSGGGGGGGGGGGRRYTIVGRGGGVGCVRHTFDEG